MATDAAKSILHSAAPGQFDSVAEYIQKMAKNLPSGWLDEIKAQHTKDVCIGVNQTVSHPLAASLKDKLNAYQDDTFGCKENVTARIALLPGGGGSNELLVMTYAEKMDPNNHYSGFWKATWTVVSKDASSAEISGVVHLHTYSYEEGNTQLRTTRDFEAASITGEDLAQGLVDKIVEWENEVLGLLAALHDMAGDSLRSIRRVLPITKTKMNWDVVAHRGRKTLGKTKPTKK